MLESSFYLDAFSQTGFIPIINGRSQKKKARMYLFGVNPYHLPILIILYSIKPSEGFRYFSIFLSYNGLPVR